MAYIDIDKFAESICNFQAIDEDAANKMIWLLRTFPIADVVPKSEVEELKDWVEAYKNTIDSMEQIDEELRTELKNAKSDVREIFEEIKKAQKEIVDRMQEFINEWKQYSESTVDYFGGKYESMEVALRLVKSILTDKNAELKKQYTEAGK